MSEADIYDDDLSGFGADLARKQAACEKAVRKAIAAGNDLPIKQAPDIHFMRQLYFTILGSLNAADIAITRKSVQTAFELCFDEHKACAALDPNQTPKLREEFNTPPAEPFPLSSNNQDAETELFMSRLRARLDDRKQIKDALGRGLRNIVPAAVSDSNDSVIRMVQDRFIGCLREQLESAHPGITKNKDHDLWQDPMMLVYTLGSENIRHSVKDAMLYAVVFSPEDDHTTTKPVARPQPPAI